MNQKLAAIKNKYSTKMNRNIKEMEAEREYTPQMTNLIIEELNVIARHKTIKDLYNEKYLSKENYKKLIKETSSKMVHVKNEQSDIARQAIANGCGSNNFEKYIIN